jgi:hypothetical protein
LKKKKKKKNYHFFFSKVKSELLKKNNLQFSRLYFSSTSCQKNRNRQAITNLFLKEKYEENLVEKIKNETNKIFSLFFSINF